MAQLDKMAKAALRHLESTLVRKLDPGIVYELYSKDILTFSEKEEVEAGKSNAERNSAILRALGRKQPTRALEALIEVLEGEDGVDKQANSYLLKKIAEEYPVYNFESGLAKHLSETEAIVPPISLLPHSQHPGVSYPSPGCLELSSITSSSSKETTDTGGNSYRMSSTPRGYCVIINNMNFTSMKDRPGSNWDAQALQDEFGNHLGFHVEPFKDLSSKEIYTLMQNLQAKDHSKLDCLVVAILSHGENGSVYGTDGVMVSVERITGYFSGTQCPSLNGKPKVFIMQACRGKKFDYGASVVATDGPDDDDPEELENIVMKEDETDGGGYSMALPDEADFILAYATTPGYVSWRNSAFGTWFIKALTDVLREQAHQEDFLSMLTEVNRKVAEEFESRGKNKQMPAPVTMLRYKLYFYPTRK